MILHFEDMTQETIQNAIKFALQKTTRENARKVSYSFRNREHRPIDTAIWWVEHVAATRGAPFTKLHSTFMNWFEYHLIDVYAVVAISVCSFLFICVSLKKMICSVFLRKEADGLKGSSKTKIH